MSIHIFCPSLIRLFVFWYWIVYAVYIFWILTPHYSFCLEVFSPIQYISFFFFFLPMISFAMQKTLSLIRFHLFIFAFVSFAWGDRSKKKMLLQFLSKSVLLKFSSRSFMVSVLTFRFLIHLELIFIYGMYEFYASLKLLVSLNHVKKEWHAIAVLHFIEFIESWGLPIIQGLS